MKEEERRYHTKAYEVALKILNDVKDHAGEHILISDLSYLVGYLQAPLELDDQLKLRDAIDRNPINQ